jgi:hypothetical protein
MNILPLYPLFCLASAPRDEPESFPRMASVQVNSSVTPVPPTDRSTSGIFDWTRESQVTLIVLGSIFAVLAVILLLVCCSRRNAIVKNSQLEVAKSPLDQSMTSFEDFSAVGSTDMTSRLFKS